MKTPLELAIEDLKWMADKQEDPYFKIVYLMCVTICEDHLPKNKMPNEQEDKRSIATKPLKEPNDG